MTRPKVVLTDTTFPDYEIESSLIAASGLDLDVSYLQTRDPDELVRQTADADAVLLAWAPFTRDVIAQLNRCRVIVRYGIGVDMIDLDAATERGIVVCNTARYCIDEVSTHAITLLLMLNRQIQHDIDHVRTAGWGVGTDRPAPRRLKGQTLGLVGLGNIGRAVAAKARGVGLDVVAYDPYLTASGAASDIRLADLDTLLATADFISIHCPLNKSTRHLISKQQLARMKPTAFLINTARGAIVDQQALESALANGSIAGAALDVFEEEPLPNTSPLRRLSNAILTPHSASWSTESALECRQTAIDHALTALRGEIPGDIVNRDVLTRGLRSWST